MQAHASWSRCWSEVLVSPGCMVSNISSRSETPTEAVTQTVVRGICRPFTSTAPRPVSRRAVTCAHIAMVVDGGRKCSSALHAVSGISLRAEVAIGAAHRLSTPASAALPLQLHSARPHIVQAHAPMLRRWSECSSALHAVSSIPHANCQCKCCSLRFHYRASDSDSITSS